MATDATGTPTSPDSIPTYNTSVDAPSGLGFNAAMAAIQTALSGRWLKTLFTTTGDIAYASGASTPARLGIGSAGQVLTVAGGIPSWAAGASGMTQIFDYTVVGSVAASIDSNTVLGGNIPATYKHLLLECALLSDNAAAQNVLFSVNNDTTDANYLKQHSTFDSAATYTQAADRTSGLVANPSGVAYPSTFTVDVQNYAGTVLKKGWSVRGGYVSGGSAASRLGTGFWTVAGATAAINRILLAPAAGNFAIGSRVTLFGLG